MQKKEQIQTMFSSISPYYDHMNDLMTFGLHRLWKKKVIRLTKIKKGDTLLDLCTGTGDLAFLAQKAVGTKGKVIAIDFCEDMLTIARKRAKNKAYGPIEFRQGDIQTLPFEESSITAITISFGLRNTEKPTQVLHEIYRVLKPGGNFVCLEATKIKIPLVKFFSDLYTNKIIPTGARLLGKNQRAYEYLPASVEHFWSTEEFVRQLEKQGFIKIKTIRLLFGASTIFIAKKPA